MRYQDNHSLAVHGPWKLVGRVAGIMLLVGACAVLVLNRSAVTPWVGAQLGFAADADPIPVLTLEQGPLQLGIEADGEIVGLQSTPIATPATGAGSLEPAWLAPEGALATAGDILIRYDSTDMLLNLESQKNTLSDNLLQAKVDTGSQELNERSLAIEQSTAEMDYDYTLKTKPEDPTIFSQWEIINAQLNADFAKSKIENLIAKVGTLKRQNQSARQISAIARTRAEAEVSVLEQAYAALAVKAPVDGLVVYRRDRRQDPNIGDSCQPGQVMIDLVNLNDLQARIYVLEREPADWKQGSR